MHRTARILAPVMTVGLILLAHTHPAAASWYGQAARLAAAQAESAPTASVTTTYASAAVSGNNVLASWLVKYYGNTYSAPAAVAAPQPAPTAPQPVTTAPQPVTTAPQPLAPVPLPATPAPQTPAQTSSVPATTSAAFAQHPALPAAEAEMLSWINGARVQAGLTPYRVDPALTTLARERALALIVNHAFTHDNPAYGTALQMERAQGMRYRLLGAEDLAAARNAFYAFNLLKNSPRHWAAIMFPDFDTIGIGVVQGPYGVVASLLFAGH